MILACAPAQYLGRQQDDLMYVVASESLLAGRGLRNLLVPGQPAMTNVNPVFPLLLAPLTWLCGGRYGWLQAFCALLLAASPWAIWLYLRRRLDETTAALAALLCASSPFFLSQSGTIMTEAPFLLLTLGLLAAAEERRAGAAGVLLLAVSQLRQAGMALLPAACAPLLRRRKASRALLCAAPALAAWLAWTLWSRRSGAGAQKLDELALSYSAGAARLALVFADNLRFYVTEWGSCALPASAGYGVAALAVGVALASAAAWGAWLILRKAPRDAACWALAGTAALHLVWPWQYERYLIMPLPLLYLAAAAALGRRAKLVFAALLGAQVLFHAPQWLGGTEWSRPELARTYGTLRAVTSGDDVLASALYVRDGYHAALRAVPLPPESSGPALEAALKAEGATVVLWQDGLQLGLSLDESSVMRRELDGVRRALADESSFILVFRDPAERARVYRLR